MKSMVAKPRRAIAVDALLALLAALLRAVNEEPVAAAPTPAAATTQSLAAGVGLDLVTGAPGAWFAKYEGIDGESVDQSHLNWTNISSIRVGVHRPDIALARRRGAPRLHNFVFRVPI